jgi:NADH-quinone oxidoreductase subunit L
LLVLLAVLGKAAQLPLCFWLPDAMVAPAPVSALLHAATMVAAGPYLLVRMHAFFNTQSLPLLAATLLGGLTMLLGAVMALSAADPKRILAYSTVSHLGLVVLSVGVMAEEAGFYHLLAHAWFKAALFLGVGYLVAIWLAEQPAPATMNAANADHKAPELKDLAGQARRYPLLLWGLMIPAGLSLAGLFPLAGALGKEEVLYSLMTRYAATPSVNAPAIGEQFTLAAAGWWVGSGMLILAIPLTAAYITRLVGVLGWGNTQRGTVHLDEGGAIPSGDKAAGSYRAGWGLPLALAVALALIGSVGWALFYYGWFITPAGFIKESTAWKWSTASPSGDTALGISLLGVIIGFTLTWYLRVARPAAGDSVFREGGMAPLISFFRNGMYLRELFQLVVGRLGELLAVLANRADIGLVDWLALRCGWLGRILAALSRWVDDYIVDGLRWLACEFWWMLKRLHSRYMQTGTIQHYMLIVLIGAALLCLVILRPLSHILAEILGRM